MMNVNKVELIGNVGRKPEIRTAASGNRVATISVATTERWTRDGTKHERTNWHYVKVLSPAIIAIVEKYVDKGQLLRIEGALHTSSYEKNGERRYSTEVVVGARGSLTMLSKAAAAGDSSNPDADPAPEGEPSVDPASSSTTNRKEAEADVPF